MALIEIDDKLAEALRTQADVRDLTLEAFLNRIAEMPAPSHSSPEFSPDEFDRSIAEVSSASPVLPGGFSRTEIYVDQENQVNP